MMIYWQSIVSQHVSEQLIANKSFVHLIGLAFICLYKMHGHPNIKDCY